MLAEMPPLPVIQTRTIHTEAEGHRASKSWWRAALSKCCCGASPTAECEYAAMPAKEGMMSVAKGSTSSRCIALGRFPRLRRKGCWYVLTGPFDKHRARREREFLYQGTG